jgi:hypothetical protein
MAQFSDVTVRIHADVRPFKRTIRRTMFRLWWWQNGPAVAAASVAGLTGLAIGFMAGIVR